MSAARYVQPAPVLVYSGANSGTAAANTAVTLTFPAPGVGYAYVLPALFWSYSGVMPAGSISVTDGTNTYFQQDVTDTGAGTVDQLNIQLPANFALTVTLAAGGASVIGKVNAYPYVVQLPPAGTTNALKSLDGAGAGLLDFSNANNSGLLL